MDVKSRGIGDVVRADVDAALGREVVNSAIVVDGREVDHVGCGHNGGVGGDCFHDECMRRPPRSTWMYYLSASGNNSAVFSAVQSLLEIVNMDEPQHNQKTKTNSIMILLFY